MCQEMDAHVTRIDSFLDRLYPIKYMPNSEIEEKVFNMIKQKYGLVDHVLHAKVKGSELLTIIHPYDMSYRISH